VTDDGSLVSVVAISLAGVKARRFWSKVDCADCWEWTACTDGDGYGRFNIGGRPWRAHRVSWALLVQDLPKGLYVDHLCRNRRCVNPDHLEPVPPVVNTKRGALASINRSLRGLRRGVGHDRAGSIEAPVGIAA